MNYLIKGKLRHKIIAVFMTITMVIGVFVQSFPVFAETSEHPDAITITVKDTNGNPIEGASVVYQIDSTINGDNWQRNTVSTDGFGAVEILRSSEYVDNDLILNASITKAGFQEEKIEDVPIDDSKKDYQIKLSETVPSGPLVSFEAGDVDYVLETSGVASEKAATLNVTDGSSIKYSIDQTDIGLTCEETTGKVTVSNFSKLGQVLERNSGTVSVNVTATKEASALYPVASDTYALNITFAETPDNAYTINGTTGENGWYTSAVKVEPSNDAHKIAKELNPGSFSTEVEFENQGIANRYVYLLLGDNTLTGKILLDSFKIDSEKPDNNITIEYSAGDREDDNGRYYKSKVDIKFSTTDATSGVDYFEWKYIKSGDAENDILDTDSTWNRISASAVTANSTSYSAEIKLPKEEAQQLRGNISVRAIDKAGNVTDGITDSKKIVIDSKPPIGSVSYELNDPSDKTQTVSDIHYFSGDVKFKFKITDTFFIESQAKVSVKKDGIIQTPSPDLNWTETSTGVYECEYILSEDGKYQVSLEYKDQAMNSIDECTSEEIIIDATAPEIMLTYYNHTHETYPQTAEITITEKNFRASDINIEALNIVDNNGRTIDSSNVETILLNYLRNENNWKSDGNDNKILINRDIGLVDGIYKITLNCTDLALNSSEQFESDEFKIDYTAPSTSKMKISYSTPIAEAILSNITFGYYKPNVKVTFTAYDTVSGVSNIIWSYEKQDGASNSNVEAYRETVVAKQDKTDKSKYVASVTLPLQDADQLRGSISFQAEDAYNNRSNSVTDTGHVLVVDTIAPTMTAEYSDSIKIVGEKMYYNTTATMMLRVTEANFDSNDVQVFVKKDGKEISATTTWTDEDTDIHIGKCCIEALDNHSNDGEYIVTVNYKDKSGNEMQTYTSKVIVIDTTTPKVNVTYSNNGLKNILTDLEGNSRKYYDQTQTAEVKITERNFDEADVTYTITAKDASGTILDNSNLISKSSWTTSGDVHTMMITYSGDANYTFDIAYKDNASNEIEEYSKDYFTVDRKIPTDFTVSYSTSILDTILSGISFGFYNAKVTVTVSAEDLTSGVHEINYSYITASGVSSVNASLKNQAIEESSIQYSNGRRNAKVSFEVPQGILSTNNQFNGTIQVFASDRSSNESERYSNGKRIVVDNIAPTSSVEYNAPVQTLGGVSYYDTDINTAISISEANFYSEDVIVTITKDGNVYPVSVSWSDTTVDNHIGTFTLSEEGDYFVSIKYIDKSKNEMIAYTSDQLTIDKNIEEPRITVNGEDADGKAFKDEVVAAVSFEDANYEDYKITLVRTSYGNKNVDVTNTFITGHVAVNETGGSGTFDTFSKIQKNDGIYTLTVFVRDKAGHEVEKSATFTVNRYGSVYEYSDYLIDLISDGGKYVQSISDDLIITEYNADKLVHQSLDIEISRDGKPLDNADYSVNPEIRDDVEIGDSGWYQYTYKIDKSNFSIDGVYKISISSEDKTGNMPENTNYDDKAILFRVDSTPPEINSITGLEESIINAAGVDVKYTVYDTIGLKSISVYVDGERVDQIEDFSADMNNYAGQFSLSEKDSAQKVNICVEDLAGNITDTDSSDFESAYVFNNSVTVSTNAFVRLFANKRLMIALIAGVILLTGVATFLIVFVRKRNEKK